MSEQTLIIEDDKIVNLDAILEDGKSELSLFGRWMIKTVAVIVPEQTPIVYDRSIYWGKMYLSCSFLPNREPSFDDSGQSVWIPELTEADCTKKIIQLSPHEESQRKIVGLLSKYWVPEQKKMAL